MSNLIRIRKGLDLHLIGGVKNEQPTDSLKTDCVAIYPDDYPGFTPRPTKKEGETIAAGEAVMTDKWNEEIAVCSPISGKVAKIVRGERRKIMRIEIAADGSEEIKKFDINDASAEHTKQLMLESGLWAQMRQRPYDIIPDVEETPRDIYISTFDSAPLAPGYTLLNNNEAIFNKGVEILARLTKGSVYVGCRSNHVIETPHSTALIVDGPHPAGNPGVQIANTKPINKGETVWTLDAETVVRIGHLFTKGYVDYSCVVAITGESVAAPCLITTTAGAKLADLLDGRLNADAGDCRIISGNVLTGQKETLDGFLHFPFRQITVIPENAHKDEFMGWASLSPKKYSFSRCFFSWLECKAKKYHFDAKINGSERAIIMAGEYDKVFPMDIYTEFLIKAIIARDIDKMEQLGIYEVAPEDFALCEFIDTSKLELQKIVREGLDFFRKEMN